MVDTTHTPLREAIEKIDEQLEELRPVAEEYLRLGEIRASLVGLMKSQNGDGEIVIEDDLPERIAQSNGHTAKPRTISHQASRNLPSGDELDYVRKGPVTQAILSYIKAHPGITVRTVSEDCGTSTPYAYDVVRNLIANDEVVRQDGKVYPKGHVSVRRRTKAA